MAQLIYKRQSVKKHLNAVARYIRLCRQIKGGEEYISVILALYNILKEQQDAAEEAQFNKEVAHDNMFLHINYLDDSLRSCSEKCKRYDRDNNGRPIYTEIFTEGKFSHIIKAPLKQKPDMVEKIVKRIEALDAENPLNVHAIKLKELITNCRNAITAHENAKLKLKEAETDKEIACSDLRKQYELNYYSMLIAFGKSKANNFFPIIHSYSKKTKEESSEESSSKEK